MSKKGRTAKVALLIISRLAEVPRATCNKLAEDIDCNDASVMMRMKELVAMNLVEPAGTVSIPGVKRSPMTYKLHRRMKEGSA